MTKADPEIHCVDFWPFGIPPRQLSGYKAMINTGQITKRTAVVNKSTGAVLVEYLSTVPHEWIKQEMGKMAQEVTA